MDSQEYEVEAKDGPIGGAGPSPSVTELTFKRHPKKKLLKSPQAPTAQGEYNYSCPIQGLFANIFLKPLQILKHMSDY